MKKFFLATFFGALFLSGGDVSVAEEARFGYISYSTLNLGDYIQAVAAKRFLPEHSIPIDREFVSVFDSNQKIKTIINGWFMQSKDHGWYRTDVPAPNKSWPPSEAIDPLLISIHFTPDFLPFALSQEGVEYLKKHGPVGARDLYTHNELQKRGIPAYFSGCLTLTLDNPSPKRNNIVYLVDLDDACVQYLKSKIRSPIVVLTHNIASNTFVTNEQRFQYAENILENYRNAKCVITTRLHATLPCLAFQTPILLIYNAPDPRFLGLIEFVRHCTSQELLSGNVNFDFNAPKKNSKRYMPYRNNLKKTVSDWVSRNTN